MRVALIALVLLIAVPASAGAAITPTRDAAALAQAIEAPDPGAAFTFIAPDSVAECANGADDDFDGLSDGADGGCAGAGDNREQDDRLAQCVNGSDDDFDESIDGADPGCTVPGDDSEDDQAPNTWECSNGFDDDGDGRVDAASDTGCTSTIDVDEGSEGAALPAVRPAALVTSGLGGFPTAGASFAILSTGDVTLAGNPDQAAFASQANNNPAGNQAHGSAVNDLVTLRVGVRVPDGANCLQVDFRFLSEEYPEFVGGSVNDQFVAELDRSTFVDDGTQAAAPDNFAFDATGNPTSVNTASMSAEGAAGTVYDGGTAPLRAATPVTPGDHAVFLSIFDRGDAVYDSAAFVDHVRAVAVPAGTCRAGASVAEGDRDSDGIPDSQDDNDGSLAPIPGKTVNVRVIDGDVFVKAPSSNRSLAQIEPGPQKGFVPLKGAATIPIGSTVDVEEGRVEMRSAATRTGAVQSAQFYSGVFQVRQRAAAAAAKLATQIKVRASLKRYRRICGPSKGTAASASGALADAAGKRKRKRVARLWGDGKGRYTTSGRSSAATVRGTIWLTEERCDGTLTKVTAGAVSVRDFARKRNVLVRAGKSYLARATRAQIKLYTAR